MLWLPLVISVSVGFGVALNLLIPHYQAEHGAGAFRPFGSLAEIDISAAGPFMAPFWATFGYALSYLPWCHVSHPPDVTPWCHVSHPPDVTPWCHVSGTTTRASSPGLPPARSSPPRSCGAS